MMTQYLAPGIQAMLTGYLFASTEKALDLLKFRPELLEVDEERGLIGGILQNGLSVTVTVQVSGSKGVDVQT